MSSLSIPSPLLRFGPSILRLVALIGMAAAGWAGLSKEVSRTMERVDRLELTLNQVATELEVLNAHLEDMRDRFSRVGI